MKPLVLLTRPQGRNEDLAARLQAIGIRSLVLPALSVQPLPLDRPVWPWPGDYDLIIFVSGNAARFYLDQLADLAPDTAWPAGTLVATVGHASAQPLYDTGFIPATRIIHPQASDQGQDSEALWRLVKPQASRFRRVLVVRGETGREWLGTQLEQAGCQVRRYAIYRREPVQWSHAQANAIKAAFESGRPVVCMATSSESVESIHENVIRCGLQPLWEHVRFVAVHERVAGRVRSLFKPISGKVCAPAVVICPAGGDAVFQTIASIASL